jgi:hypothetical protein
MFDAKQWSKFFLAVTACNMSILAVTENTVYSSSLEPETNLPASAASNAVPIFHNYWWASLSVHSLAGGRSCSK